MAFSAVFGMSLLEHGVSLQQGCSLHTYIESYLLKIKFCTARCDSDNPQVFVKRGKSWEEKWPFVAMCCACDLGGSFILGKSWFASQRVCCYEKPDTEVSLRGWSQLRWELVGWLWEGSQTGCSEVFIPLWSSCWRYGRLYNHQCLCCSETPESLISSLHCQIPPTAPQTPGAGGQFSLQKCQRFCLNSCSPTCRSCPVGPGEDFSIWSLGAAISWGFCSSCRTPMNVTRREVTPIWQLVSWSWNQSCWCDFMLQIVL